MSYEMNCSMTNDIAANWALRNSFEKLADDDQVLFEEWLAQSADHVQAYDRACLVMQDISDLKHLPQGAALREEHDRKQHTVWAIVGAWLEGKMVPSAIIGTACAVLIAVIYILPEMMRGSESTYATEISEIRDIALADGSHVTLGARSEIKVSFSEEARRVTLLKGRAFFSVEKDKQRPFYVTAAKSVVKVVGTRFDVHLGARQEQISVLEGLVAVTPLRQMSEGTGHMLLAGEQLTLTDNTTEKSAIVQVPGEWRKGRFVYEGTPLIEVINDANRYYHGEIRLADSSLGTLLVTTSFSVKQIDKMVETLTYILPVKAQRISGGRVILLSKNSP